MPIHVSQRRPDRAPRTAADPRRLPSRRRRHQGRASAARSRGEAVTDEPTHDRRPPGAPGSSDATSRRSAPRSRSELGSTTSMQVPAPREDRAQHGRRARRRSSTSLLDGRVERPHDHRRPEAARSPRPEVDRRVQAPRGQGHRLQGHAARRPHVGVPRPAGQSVAIPRIRDFRGLDPDGFDGRGNYTFGVERADRSSRRSTTTGSTRSAGMDITIVTTARTDEEGRALLDASASRSAPRATRPRSGPPVEQRKQRRKSGRGRGRR